MKALFETIRTATASEATDEARAAGAAACRTILTALEAKAGEPMPAPTEPTAIPAVAATAALLRTMPPEQLLDLLIGKLRTLVPEGPSPSPATLAIPLVKVPTP